MLNCHNQFVSSQKPTPTKPPTTEQKNYLRTVKKKIIVKKKELLFGLLFSTDRSRETLEANSWSAN